MTLRGTSSGSCVPLSRCIALRSSEKLSYPKWRTKRDTVAADVWLRAAISRVVSEGISPWYAMTKSAMSFSVSLSRSYSKQISLMTLPLRCMITPGTLSSAPMIAIYAAIVRHSLRLPAERSLPHESAPCLKPLQSRWAAASPAGLRQPGKPPPARQAIAGHRPVPSRTSRPTSAGRPAPAGYRRPQARSKLNGPPPPRQTTAHREAAPSPAKIQLPA